MIISAKVRHEAIYGQLSGIAPTVFTESTGPTWKENILLVGEILGVPDLAQQKVDDYLARARAIGEDAVTADPTLTASSVRFTGGATMRLHTSSSFVGQVFADIGLPRPAGQPDAADAILVEISQELIPEIDATHIFASVWAGDGGESRAQADLFESNPLWASLAGDVHIVDDRTWVASVSLQGANAILGEVAETLGVPAHR